MRLGEELAGLGRRGGRQGGQGRRTPRLTHSSKGGCLTPATAWPPLPPASNFAADVGPSPANLDRSRTSLPPLGTPPNSRLHPPWPLTPALRAGATLCPRPARDQPLRRRRAAGGSREGRRGRGARLWGRHPPPCCRRCRRCRLCIFPLLFARAPRDEPPRPLGAPLTRC